VKENGLEERNIEASWHNHSQSDNPTNPSSDRLCREAEMNHTYIDLSYPIEAGMPVLPNYPPVEITILDATSRQEPGGPLHLNSSRIAIGLHTGTHMDAPFHFIHAGKTFERIPLEQCAGPAVLVRLPDHGPGAPITPQDLVAHESSILETRKVVLATGWHRRWGGPAFFTEHPVITRAAAELLVDWGIHLVGVDFPSVDRPPHEAHFAFLGSGAVIVENLTNLNAISGDRFYLTALPLNLVGRDGCPVRAVGQEI
jgi:kynurenine formamidase